MEVLTKKGASLDGIIMLGHKKCVLGLHWLSFVHLSPFYTLCMFTYIQCTSKGSVFVTKPHAYFPDTYVLTVVVTPSSERSSHNFAVSHNFTQLSIPPKEEDWRIADVEYRLDFRVATVFFSNKNDDKID